MTTVIRPHLSLLYGDTKGAHIVLTSENHTTATCLLLVEQTTTTMGFLLKPVKKRPHVEI